MQYIILSDDKTMIENIIVADNDFAQSMSAVPFYEGAEVGQPYNPPQTLTEIQRLQQENNQLSAKVKAAQESNSMLEDCIAEMAAVVYA